MNVQNIPRDLLDVKRCFIPKHDVFLFFDYKNIEVRLLAYYLHRGIADYSLVHEFKTGKDPHVETAAKVFGVDSDEVDDRLRQAGKTINFSIIYGGGVPTLQRQLGHLGWDQDDCRDMLREFHLARPGIKLLGKELVKKLDDRGYIIDLYGRHQVPDSPHKSLNYLIQGSAAGMMKRATVKVNDWLRSTPHASIVNIVHDELIIDTANHHVTTLTDFVPSYMIERKVFDVVETPVEISISRNTWADKEKF